MRPQQTRAYTVTQLCRINCHCCYITGAVIKSPDSLSKISTYVNESYNFTGHQPPRPTPRTPVHSNLRHMSMPAAKKRDEHYENHASIRAHRPNTVSGLKSHSIKTQHSQSKDKHRSHSTPSMARDEVYENSVTIQKHRANAISGIVNSSSSYMQGRQRRGHTETMKGDKTPSTPSASFPSMESTQEHKSYYINSRHTEKLQIPSPASFPSQHTAERQRESRYINSGHTETLQEHVTLSASFTSPHTAEMALQRESDYINSLSGYTFLTPENLYASNTYSDEGLPYLDFQPYHHDNDHPNNHFYDVDKYHHYDMDSQLSESENHTYEIIPEIPEPSSD